MAQKSPKKSYRVGRSRSGLGLFANQPIKKGALIMPYGGRLLDCNKKEDDAVNNKYLFELDKRWTIDGSARTNMARYINHSCKPNAEAYILLRKRQVQIYAKRNIQEGEEISYDYGKSYFEAYLKPLGCKCAACEMKRKKAAHH
jgi:uncharacterized protein